ncbi:hypothetical protein [Rhodopirellula sp. P2]|uniref:hypothetical protein n=1 Tax=Rhodopirellula sp. P2 TaxID=2127060 RepID=UPI00236780C2|nr:hypothetical protein [Rhodopirellula sp. P2]WDQ15736.1 hypothetical protein PSR62_19095 [Rhodopirellula sp. P2]
MTAKVTVWINQVGSLVVTVRAVITLMITNNAKKRRSARRAAAPTDNLLTINMIKAIKGKPIALVAVAKKIN